MAIKNLLIAYNGTESSDAALDLALHMRDKYDAHLTGLLAHIPGAINQASAAWIPKDIQDKVTEAQIQNARDIEEKFNKRIASSLAKDKIHWITKRGDGDATLARCARLYDLTIIGRYDAVLGDDLPELHPDMIAMISGRPVLLVPREFDISTFNEHAVLAWDGKRAATRALSDAMQILETKSLVTIVTVSDDQADLCMPDINIETALQRHGVKTERVLLERKGKSVGKRILKYLEKSEANLLVMGAYEHSKFRQAIIGGVTSSVLKKARVPIIISH